MNIRFLGKYWYTVNKIVIFGIIFIYCSGQHIRRFFNSYEILDCCIKRNITCKHHSTYYIRVLANINGSTFKPLFVVELMEQQKHISSIETELSKNCHYFSGDVHGSVNKNGTTKGIVRVKLCLKNKASGWIINGKKKYNVEYLINTKMKEKSFKSEKIRKKRSLSRKHILVVKQVHLFDKKTYNIVKEDSAVEKIAALSQNFTNENKKNEITLHKNTEDFKTKKETHLNIGVMVGIDYDVVAFHGLDRIESYIITLFKIVNSLFKHQSLGIKVKITVTQIHYLKQDESEQILVKDDPVKSISNVCRWRVRKIKKLKNKFYKEDVTIVLSRHFAANNYTGYAKRNGICTKRKACAIVQENGFSRAIDIAHEIGHTLGFKHDRGSKCEGNIDGNIMSPNTQASSLNYFWSNCSRNRLLKRLENKQLKCLMDQPVLLKKYAKPLLYPGTSYTIDEQCKLEFGPYFIHPQKKNENFCKRLSCYNPSHPSKLYTMNEPAMNATNCGLNKWCISGKCVIKPDKGPDDGIWGSWSHWSKCDLPCDPGFSYRTRNCDSPKPHNGGRDCEGPTSEGILCNQLLNCTLPRKSPLSSKKNIKNKLNRQRLRKKNRHKQKESQIRDTN